MGCSKTRLLAECCSVSRARCLVLFAVLGATLPLSSCFLIRGAPEAVAPLGRKDFEVHDSPHRVGLIDSGWRALALRIHLIRSAEHSIDLQTFIWTEDEVGKLVAYELIEAARRGVRVRLISDGLHTRLSREFAAHLATAAPGLELRLYNPRYERIAASWDQLLVDGLLEFEGRNQRAHDKVMCVDGNWALLGGRNLENTYYDYAAGMNFHDREVLVEGDVVGDVIQSFERFWDYELTIPAVHLRDVEHVLEDGSYARPESPAALGIDGILAEVDATLLELSTIEKLLCTELLEVNAVAFCCDPPGKLDGFEEEDGGVRPNHVSRALAGLIRNAEQSVLVQTPYFVLTDGALEMLEDLREEHPEIEFRASTNSLASIDIFPAQAVTYRQKRFVIDRLGILLYEFKPRPEDMTTYIERHAELASRTQSEPRLCLHSKSVVIDGELSGVGSHNLGPRSAETNTEVMLLVWDREFAERLTHSIERDIHPRNSWVVCRREQVLVLGYIQRLLEEMSSAVGALAGLDVWPSFYASSYELREGAEPVAPGHPDFYKNYRAVGLFPGVSNFDERLWMTRVMKAGGSWADPLL